MSEQEDPLIESLLRLEAEIQRERRHLEANGEWASRWCWAKRFNTDSTRTDLSWVGPNGLFISISFTEPKQ